MRLTYLKLTGYIGIEDGLGLNSIEIDFSKSQNLICLLAGKNGAGKSTINSAASPLPDSSSCFVDKKHAEKEEYIVDGDIVYHILIIHPIDGNGNRKQSKAFIHKNGEELNPNGNITSYKEIVCTEFDLDPNFISLTRLASDDRGLVDKRPAERKKYASAIVESLETYNNMHKILSKKSSIFKSHINALSSKISNAGDVETSKFNLEVLEARMSKLDDMQRQIQEDISKYKSMIEMTDPDGTIQEQYGSIADSIVEINDSIDSSNRKIKSLCDKYSVDANNIDNLINESENKKQDTESELLDYKMQLRNLIDDSSNLSVSIQSKSVKIESMKNDFDYENLIETIDKYRNTIHNQEEILKECGLYRISVSKEEYLLIFMKLKSYRDAINAITSDIDDTILSEVISYIKGEKNFEEEVFNINKKLENIKNNITENNTQLAYYNGQLDNTKVLEKRPNECKIDHCELINKALESLATKPQENIDRLTADIEELNELYKLTKEDYDFHTLINNPYRSIVAIINDIESNSSILSKLHTSIIFINRNEFIKRISNRNSFNEVEDCDKYIRLADSIDGYNDNKSILKDLENELKIHENKNQIIEELANEVSELNDKLCDATRTIERLNRSIAFNTGVIRNLENTHSALLSISEQVQIYNQKLAEKAVIREKFISIKDNISKIKDNADKVNNLYNQYNSLSDEINPLKRQRDDLKFNIKLAEEYNVELAEYQAKFDMIETLKKYSSPSSGIQTIYMNIYMNKTLSLANELLSYMFDGDLELLPYIINADEFRIPVKHSSGMISDDISSCSGAQISMISMVVSLSLLIQASSKFNIIRFDEIDGALDSSNRMMFVDVIKRIGASLGIEQIIMVSHSIEIEMGQVDAVILALPKGTEYNYNGANVIYNYYDRNKKTV